MSIERHTRKNTIFSGHLNDAESLIPVHSSYSAEISSKKLTGAVCTQNHENNMQHVHMKAKTLVDQMPSDRKFFVKQRSSHEHKPFSHALEFFGTKKDLFMEFLPGPNLKIVKFIDPVLNEKSSECDIKDANGMGKSLDDHFLEKNNGKCRYSSKTSFKAHPEKIVILKPASQNAECSDNIACRCSSLPSYKKSNDKTLKAKPASFFFKGMKRKLRNTLAGTKKEPNQFFMDGNPHRLATSRSIFKVGDRICREVNIKDTLSSDIMEIKENPCKKPCPKKGPDIVCMSNSVRQKLDFPGVSLSKTREFDVIIDPRRRLSTSVKNITEIEIPMRKKSSKTSERILSTDHDFWLINPRTKIPFYPRDAHMRFSPFSNPLSPSPLRPDKEATTWDDFRIYDGVEILEAMTSSSRMRSNVNQAHKGKTTIEEMSYVKQSESSCSELSSEINSAEIDKSRKRIDSIKSSEGNGNEIHLMDSLPESETMLSAVYDVPSTPSSIHQSNISDTSKYQEERRSPISVLEPFFSDDSVSSECVLLQSAEQEQLQPLRVDFEECSVESIPQNPETFANSSSNENTYISSYVHSVLQVSGLKWEHLSPIKPPTQEPLDHSLLNEVEFQPVDSHTDPKLLFDHINEVLLQMYQSHFCFPPWMAFIKPKMVQFPLAEAVLHEIMREVDFYLLPQTEKRTLNQIVSKDVANSRWWLDVRLDTEQIVVHASEEVLEESILDAILELIHA